jgi:hypothetical protein
VKGLLCGKTAKERPLRLKSNNGIELIVRNPTPQGIQTFLDAVAAAIKRIAKDNLPITILPDLLG